VDDRTEFEGMAEICLSGVWGLDGRRVEICFNRTWETMCDDSWDDKNVSVVCRQLGLSSGGGRLRIASKICLSGVLSKYFFIKTNTTGYGYFWMMLVQGNRVISCKLNLMPNKVHIRYSASACTIFSFCLQVLI